MATAFSLLGGPLHALGRRVGLVRGASNSVPLGLVLGVGTWIVLVVLAWIGGSAAQLFSLSLLAGHVRFLVVIPLFFVCEAWIDPRLATFIEVLIRSGVVPESLRPALDAEVARVRRWKDSWIPDAACVALVVLWSVSGARLDVPGVTNAFEPGHAAGGASPLAMWYWYVGLPLFRFLALRWLVRLALWTFFLARLARFDLRLVPTHPDNAAGLGYLELVHRHFVPMVFALSALQAAALAEEISTGGMSFEGVYSAFAVVLVVDAVLFVGPLFLFAPKLWAAQVKGLADYMDFAAGYVTGFDRKWLQPGEPGEPLLGTPDLQSLADLNNSVSIVRNMRWVPVDLPLLRDYGIAALLPLLPLFLLKYPIAELAQRFIQRLSGLQP